MKTVKILFLFIFGIFLINIVSAINVYGEWLDESQNAQIEFGDSIQFEASFFSYASPTIIQIVFNENYTFPNPQINQESNNGYTWYYGNSINTVTQSIYQTPGTYTIIISGWDNAGQSMSETLTLTVNPAPQPPPNNPPDITSTPITQVNENNLYIYQVVATDADNDTLTYSLTPTQCWLSINPTTGLIAGIAPEVDYDTNFTVEVKVSDGKDFATQNYILTVKNIPIPDTTSPVITLLGNDTVTVEVFSVYNDAGATAWDNVDGNLTGNIVVVNPVNVNVLGTYIITYDVTDSSGNAATQVTRTVNVVDTTSPVITLLGENPQNITLGNPYAEKGAIAMDNYDGNLTNNITKTSNVDVNVLGAYTVNYSVSDNSGNNVAATRIVNVVPTDPPEEPDEPSDDKDGKKTKSTYTYEDIDEERYFEQLAQEKPKIELISEEPQPQKSWIIFLIGAIILVLLFGVIITLARIFKTRK